MNTQPHHSLSRRESAKAQVDAILVDFNLPANSPSGILARQQLGLVIDELADAVEGAVTFAATGKFEA